LIENWGAREAAVTGVASQPRPAVKNDLQVNNGGKGGGNDERLCGNINHCAF
jgi:hypothetical protein